MVKKKNESKTAKLYFIIIILYSFFFAYTVVMYSALMLFKHWEYQLSDS